MTTLIGEGAVAQVPADVALDATRKARTARADGYFRDDLRDQRGWYSRKASDNKTWGQRLGLTVIACGALITFLQIFAPAPWVNYVTGAFGVLVALIEGAQRIWKFDEMWRGYRVASERMKRELRLYVNGAGTYTEVADEDTAYRAFVTAIEQIIAEEQQIHWQSRGRGPTVGSAPDTT
jgi:hypothetical protein